MFPGRRPAPYVVWQDEPGEWCIWGMLRNWRAAALFEWAYTVRCLSFVRPDVDTCGRYKRCSPYTSYRHLPLRRLQRTTSPH